MRQSIRLDVLILDESRQTQLTAFQADDSHELVSGWELQVVTDNRASVNLFRRTTVLVRS